jgi:hypothetical protein
MPDFGASPDASWFSRLLDWTRGKITFEDNIDGRFLTVNIGTTETEIGHTLGRVPRYILEVASYPNGTAGIQFTKSPTIDKLYLKRGTAGQCTLFLM